METPVHSGDLLLGKYHVERVLGKGGMGVVVAARHIELGELFAIKFLLPEALASPDALDRFLREARALARLKGEHIVKVHDVGRLETGAPYMVMEHLEGSDLKDVLRSRGPLPVGEAVTLALQACDAIAEAHAARIIHRDLKPANLFLIRRPNGSPCVKVLDFGISKHVAHAGVDLTKTSAVMGSPLYMSPEQMTRTKDADARSDIWALGIVLYELVTGRTPFIGETITEVVARVLQEEPAPPSRLSDGVPAAFDAIVARCLQKNRDHRFQSVGELMEALQSLGAARPASASVMPPVDRTVPLAPVSRPAVATPLPMPKLEGKTAPLIEPPAAPQVLPPPASAVAGRASVTGSAWGQTKSGGRAGSAKAGAVIAAVLSFSAVAAVSAWVVRWPASGDAPAAHAIDLPVAAPIASANEAALTPGAALRASEPGSTPTEGAAPPLIPEPAAAAPTVAVASTASAAAVTSAKATGAQGSAQASRPAEVPKTRPPPATKKKTTDSEWSEVNRPLF